MTGPLDTRTSYDRVAADYAERLYDELLHKPFDRQLLDRFAASISGRGVVVDLGCGPGQVGRYLHDRGVPVLGIDLSTGMIEQARRLNPQMDFREADMRALPFDDEEIAGIVCFYAIIHIARQETVFALREIRRVLEADGLLLLAFHIGSEEGVNREWWGHEVAVSWTFFELAEMEGYLADAGFQVLEALERPPYPDVEYQSQRGYVLARRT
jgi:SAM-dependent methyltransferase